MEPSTDFPDDIINMIKQEARWAKEEGLTKKNTLLEDGEGQKMRYLRELFCGKWLFSNNSKQNELYY